MTPQSKKIRLVSLLIFLIVALALISLWLINIEIERNLSKVPFGSLQEIMAIILLLSIIIALFFVANLLQKNMDQVPLGIIKFPPLNPQQQINIKKADNYFTQTTPRPLDQEIFKAIWNGIFPFPVRILLWSLVPISLSIMVLFLSLAMWASEDTRKLDKGPINQVEGKVTNVQKKNRRHGIYYEIDYQYMPNTQSRLLKGTSFTDNNTLNIADIVDIEYLIGSEHISRITNLRTTPTEILPFVLLIVAMTCILVPAVIIFLYWRKGYVKAMLCHGLLLEGQIEKLKKSGKGMVFVQISINLHGVKQTKKLIYPAVQELYGVLYNRQKEGQTIKILVHPDKYRHAYLIEPHLINHS